MATIKGKFCATCNSGSKCKLIYLIIFTPCFQLFSYVDAIKNTNSCSVSPHPLYICTHLWHLRRLLILWFHCSLLICALSTSIGMTFLILACAIPNPKIFYPFFVLLFYVLTVLPVFIAQRSNSGGNDITNPKIEFAFFLASGMLLSAFALPIVLANSAVVSLNSHKPWK